MLIRRTIAAVLTTMVLTALAVGPAHAARPIHPPGQAPDNPGERPLTPEEQAASDRKVQAAEAYIASMEASGSTLMPLSCVAPDATDGSDEPTTRATTQACTVPQEYLGVAARDQVKGHYCGPAVGQVIANYTWAMSATGNKYSQGTIAGWMSTDVHGLTNAPELEDGLERATTGSPRRPANWDWVVTRLLDYDGDGVLGDDLQDFVRSNISGSKMPLAIPVKPYDIAGKYHLSSWKKPVSSPGHWIAAYGWYSLWAGNDFSRIYYTDSSRDEGGSTGKYWDPTRHLAEMIRVHTGRFVW
jgi:hypothetical protein